MTTRTDFDVLVGGGGMIGAAVAALLATDPRARELKVALAESRPASMPLAGEPPELRVSALSRRSERVLAGVGAWEALKGRAPSPYVRMRVWDCADAPDGAGALVFDAAAIGEPNLGHIVENRSVAAALTTVALRNGVTLVRAPLDGLALSPDGARVTVGDRALEVSLVVAADGARSRLREWGGIAVRAQPYDQRALVARLEPAQPHGREARQRFLPGGPLALLPLSDGAVSLVWSMPAAQAEATVALGDEDFARLVTEASGAVLGELAAAGARASFPLSRDHAATYGTLRLALVGDAAHTIHPLAGQGANLGFADAATLVEVVLAARDAGQDIGDPATLARYTRARRADNLIVSGAMEAIHRLFGDSHAIVGRARRAGLALVQRSGPAKARLMREALGLGAAPGTRQPAPAR